MLGRLQAEGLHAGIDYFGEGVTDPASVEEVVNEYLRLNRALVGLKPPVNVWADLSNFGLDISDLTCRKAIQRVVETLPQGSFLQVRAHDSDRMEGILRTVFALAAEGVS